MKNPSKVSKKKKQVLCVGGPLNGEIILLTPDSPGHSSTLEFTLYGETGRYIDGGWIPALRSVPSA